MFRRRRGRNDRRPERLSPTELDDAEAIDGVMAVRHGMGSPGRRLNGARYDGTDSREAEGAGDLDVKLRRLYERFGNARDIPEPLIDLARRVADAYGDARPDSEPDPEPPDDDTPSGTGGRS